MRVAISGLSGVGSSATAQLVSQRLGLTMSNFTFRSLAQERGVAFEQLQRQAESDPSIDYELDRRLIDFGQSHEACLIATDLACWLDSPHVYQRLGLDRGVSYDFKIWLEAPLAVRAARLAEREGSNIASVINYNNQRDQDNRARYQRLYEVDIADHRGIDWVYDTSSLDLKGVAAAICLRLDELSQSDKLGNA